VFIWVKQLLIHWNQYGPSSVDRLFKDFVDSYNDSYAKALASPYSTANGVSGVTIYDLFKSTTSASNLDIKYRASVLEQIKNSGLLRTYRRNWWNERIFS
jgi:hypothetical protein